MTSLHDLHVPVPMLEPDDELVARVAALSVGSRARPRHPTCGFAVRESGRRAGCWSRRPSPCVTRLRRGDR